MVKFAAPQHTQGPLAGYEVYDYRHYWHANPLDDPSTALGMALCVWREWGWPDHFEVDAVYESSLSPPAGSQDDPFLGLEGQR